MDRRGPKACVYFIEAQGLARIKIGYTKANPLRRLEQLQVTAPTRLALRAFFLTNTVGEARDVETTLHRAFAGVRVKGEWFEATDELRGFVAEHATRWPFPSMFNEDPTGWHRDDLESLRRAQRTFLDVRRGLPPDRVMRRHGLDLDGFLDSLAIGTFLRTADWT